MASEELMLFPVQTASDRAQLPGSEQQTSFHFHGARVGGNGA